MDLAAVILFQGVTITADFALILHQDNTILPRADHIGMKKTPRSIVDFRLHGTPPGARGKHTFCIGNSLRNQSHSWPFQLFPSHITDADKLATSDSEGFDFHLVAALGRP